MAHIVIVQRPFFIFNEASLAASTAFTCFSSVPGLLTLTVFVPAVPIAAPEAAAKAANTNCVLLIFIVASLQNYCRKFTNSESMHKTNN